jgi:hypothetical protein
MHSKGQRLKKFWKLWALALGEKASHQSKDADLVAGIRTIVFITYFTTNLFIISGVVRHWDSCQKSNNVSMNIEKNFSSTKRL